MLLGLTIDTDRLAGPNVELPEHVEMDREHGKECFDQLLCPYTMYIPISGNRTFYDLGGLLPGSNYYFTVRAVNEIGKGDFSAVTGAVMTKPQKLGATEPIQLESVSEFDVRVSFRLPFNQGLE